MKKLAGGVLTAIFLVIVVILLSINVFGGIKKQNGSSYSTYSIESNGFKAIYLLTGQMGYEVKRNTKPPVYLPEKATLVMLRPDWELVNRTLEKKYIRKWVEDGNTIILVDQINQALKEFTESITDNKPMFTRRNDIDQYSFRVGKGFIIEIDDYEVLENTNLRNSYYGAEAFIYNIDEAENGLVLFDEYYHGLSGSDSITVWDIIGQTGRIVCIQIFIGLLILIYTASRRLGPSISLPDNYKTPENHRMAAEANLAASTRSFGFAVEMYMYELSEELEQYTGSTFSEDAGVIKQTSSYGIIKEKELNSLFAASRTYIERNCKNKKVMLKIVKKIDGIRRRIVYGSAKS